jgi:hypothetical protein
VKAGISFTQNGNSRRISSVHKYSSEITDEIIESGPKKIFWRRFLIQISHILLGLGGLRADTEFRLLRDTK